MHNIFQSKEWEQFKLETGYQKSYRVENILVLQKNLPFGFSMLYSPMVGSEAAGIMNNESRIKELKKQISLIAIENNSIFWRIELDAPVTDHNSKPASPVDGFIIQNSRFGFAKAFEEMQPEHTLVLDLNKTSEDLLAEMKQKGRYNIKIAEKNNINITFSNKSGIELDHFYSLYSETAKRHKITYRQKKYFSRLVDLLGELGYARCYNATARVDGKDVTLAAAITIYEEERAIYMFGASSDEYKNLMAPYLMQWTMIRDAKEMGKKKYDFFGIAPDDNPNHPWAGVTRFKKQFGGEQVNILGSYDLVLKPMQYQLFKIAEKIRR